MIIRTTAKIVPGKSRGPQTRTVKRKRVGGERVDKPVEKGGEEVNRVYVETVAPKMVKTSWSRDPKSPSKKGVTNAVCICISMPSQLFTDLHLFARKMRMNHSHLLRTALEEMMTRNGWNHGPTP